MKKGNYYLINLKFPVVTDRKTGKEYNKVSVVKVVPYNNNKILLINILVVQQYQKAIINMKKQLCFNCINDKFWENGSTVCWNCFQFKGANNG